MLLNNVKKEILENISHIEKECGSVSLLLAYSAGIDSSVLLDLLINLKVSLNFNIDICHVNHNFNLNSNAMENRAKRVARKYNLKSYIYNYNFDSSVNFEADSREFRYSVLNTLKNKYKYDFIITAHHFDDNIETLEMRSRGNYDWTSMLGIRKNIKSIIRPMLVCRKFDIINYARTKKIKYIEDSSNDDITILRNKVRLVDLPKKRAKNVKYDEELYNIHQNALQNLDNLKNKMNNESIIKIANNYIIAISKEALTNYSFNETKLALQGVIDNYFGQFIIKTKSNWLNLFNYLGSTHKLNKFYQLDKYIRVSASDKFIYIDKLQAFPVAPKRIKFSQSNYWWSFNFNVVKVSSYIKSENNNFIVIPSNLFKKGISIKAWKYGDSIKINDSFNKKISDIFIDNKLPLIMKHTFPLICNSNNEIIWIPGLKTSCISLNDSGYVKISYIKEFSYD